MKDNELIAEFMGYELVSHPGLVYQYWEKHTIDEDGDKERQTLCAKDKLLYHNSWDWLMPVVNKIAQYRMAYPKETSWVCDCKVVVYIDMLYREVVAFIKWHNENGNFT